jgi:hypothetical protein
LPYGLPLSGFPTDHIKRRTNDYRGPGEGPGIWYILEKPKAQNSRMNKFGIFDAANQTGVTAAAAPMDAPM